MTHDGRKDAIRWKTIEEIFEAVVGLPPRDREEALDRLCPAAEPAIRACVVELLDADEAAADFLEDSPFDDHRERIFEAFARPPGPPTPDDPPGESENDVRRLLGDGVEGVRDLAPGDTIDERYRLDAVLGEGGMGTVFRATQTAPIEREVAVKVIKLGMDTRSVISRFEMERQTLAVMNHPNIARILDAGATERGRPYFVMELVPGAPITTYCSDHGLDVDARLRLFLDVCGGVQHAHQKGIIHRDLKPGNVLVTEQDGKAVAKVIDFGIAKATGGSASEHTLFTDPSLLLGTPAYMSPEQVDGGAAVDTRTDVYALGLVLYELLTEVPAFNAKELRQAGLFEMQRVIKEVDPDRPSTRVGRVKPRSEHAAASLRRRLRGDLDWIVMKALAKDPERRYETARALALDIRRHFENQPVLAGPPSTAYVLGKFARRKKRLLAVVAAFVLLMLAAVVAMYRTSQEAIAARNVADAQLRISNIERGRLLGRTGDVGAAGELIWREFLRAPDELHAYWALWEEYMRSHCVATVAGHAGRADEIDGDTRGTLLVSSGDDGRVVIREASTLRVTAVLDGPDNNMRALACSEDGRLVAAGGGSGIIVVWEVATGRPLRRWQASGEELLAMDFAPDGRRLVSGGGDGIVRLWDAGSGALIASMDEASGLVQSLRFNPDGTLIAAGHRDLITLWDGVASHPPRRFPARREVHTVAFSHDGRLLAGGGQEQRIDLWELPTGSRVASFEGFNSTLRALAFSPDDRSLFSAGWYSADRWDLARGERVWTVPTAGPVWGMVLDPDGRLLTASFEDGGLRRWEVDRDGGVYRPADGVTRKAAAFGPDGLTLVSGDDHGLIRMEELTTGRILGGFPGHDAEVRSLDLSADGSRFASASADDSVRVWDMGSGDLLLAVNDAMIQTSRAVDLDDAGHRVAYAAVDGRFKLRSIANDHAVEMVPPTGAETLSAVFNPDQQSLSTIARDNRVRSWSLDGEPLATFTVSKPEGGLWTMAFSPDGALIALGMWNRLIRVLKVADGSVVATLEGHGGTVWSTAFKPDEPRVLASGAGDGTVRLWDIQDGLNLATITVAPGRDVHSVKFSPDGTTLLAAGEFAGPVCYDLTHFDRHIAGNLEYQIGRVGGTLDHARVSELRAWAAAVTERPWPRFGRDDRAP